MTRTALVLQHHNHITLGNLEPVLREHNYEIKIVDATSAPFDEHEFEIADLLIVLGGHEGAYETDTHPYLKDELAVIRKRIDAKQPTFGVCLGAQLMAGALGGENYKGEKPDLGYQQLQLTQAGRESVIRHAEGVGMLEWHGDHFTLPEGATVLASSSAYPNEAFAIGDFGLAVQFHPEVTDEMHAQWSEDTDSLLAKEGVSRQEWERQRELHNDAMQVASNRMFSEWLDGLEARTP